MTGMVDVAALVRRMLAVLLAVALGALLTACGDSTPRGSVTYGPGASEVAQQPTGAASPYVTPTPLAALAPSAPVSSLPTVLVAALPPEAVDTLRLVAQDGPFPYAKDGATFANREGLLPPHAVGWYHEYTVVTPGSPDRGARRIVAGSDGSRFYTDDHYASFREVLSGVHA